jgi:hypothetical protein
MEGIKELFSYEPISTEFDRFSRLRFDCEEGDINHRAFLIKNYN